jgi:hypothetical protein
MAHKISGGGITSNKLVRPGVKAGGPNTNKVNERGVFQLGTMQGDALRPSGGHTGQSTALPLMKGTASQVPSGNQVAAQTVAGPGGSRTVMRSGSQGVHGAPIPDTTPKPGNWFEREFPGNKGRG